jgi:hypothetical protein
MSSKKAKPGMVHIVIEPAKAGDEPSGWFARCALFFSAFRV